MATLMFFTGHFSEFCARNFNYQFQMSISNLVDISDIFNFFLLRGGEGGVRSDREGGGSVFFFFEIPGGGGSQEGVGGGEGPGRVSEGNLGELGGGGAKYFFSGPKCPPISNVNFTTRICRHGHADISGLWVVFFCPLSESIQKASIQKAASLRELL